jgi:hypothetical protein
MSYERYAPIAEARAGSFKINKTIYNILYRELTPVGSAEFSEF